MENECTQTHQACVENYDGMVDCLEEVYGNAYRALQFGATKESLLGEIDYALEMYKNDKLRPGACPKCGQQPKDRHYIKESKVV